MKMHARPRMHFLFDLIIRLMILLRKYKCTIFSFCEFCYPKSLIMSVKAVNFHVIRPIKGYNFHIIRSYFALNFTFSYMF